MDPWVYHLKLSQPNQLTHPHACRATDPARPTHPPALATALTQSSHDRGSHMLNHFATVLCHFAIVLNHFASMLSHFIIFVSHFATMLSYFAILLSHFVIFISHFDTVLSYFYDFISHL
jgi:hypothetical protein